MWEKKFSFWSIPTRPGIGNSRKIEKKFKKLKNIDMASFQAKTWRERLRMWEKKILVLIHSNPIRNREFQKNSKKIQKIKKHHYGFFSIQNGTGPANNEIEKKKSFLSVPSQFGIFEVQKNSKKLQKTKKHQYGFF